MTHTPSACESCCRRSDACSTSQSRHTSAVTYLTLLSRQPPRTSPKSVSAACCQTTRLSISLSVLRSSGSMNNGLHAGSGVSCHVKPSRQTWPRPSCALTWNVLRDQSVDDLIQLYRDVLTRLLDQHCPFITVRRRRKKTKPRFDTDCRDARRCARAAERRFRRQRRDEDRREWSLKLQHMRSLYKVKCNGYWRLR